MKILKIFFFLFFLFSFSFVNAESIPVDKIFKDINKNYPYYKELQSLYDRGIIFPDKDGNFSPNSQLTRDEFVWIISEVSCKKCIKPDTDFSFVQKYSNKDFFFDISKDNKYFYCIAEWVESEQVTWYQEWTTCNNWVYREGEKPFCPKNNIILEEALAIILRASNLLTLKEAEGIRNDVKIWKEFPKISWISPKLSNGAVYSFYPDFQKAYEYTFTDYDKDWNEKKLKLLDFSKNIDPKKAITREDFLKMAYIALKNNSCKDVKSNAFWLQIEVLDKTCSEKQTTCKSSDFAPQEKVFDFRWKISRINDEWFVYNWKFFNYETWQEILKEGKYLDNYNFIKSWKYRVYLKATSPKKETSETYLDLKIFDKDETQDDSKNKSGYTSYITSDKTWAKSWENISFTWYVTKWWKVKYSWDFWDWNTDYWKVVNHSYWTNWTYTVTLTTIDSEGNTSTSTVNINISNTPWYDGSLKDTDWDGVPDENDNEINTPKDKKNYVCTEEFVKKWLYNCWERDIWIYNPLIQESITKTKDTDWDGTNDTIDQCPNIKWDKKNFWCPIFEKSCELDSDCWKWLYCDDWYCKIEKYSLNCAYSWWDIINGNVKCTTCPCDISINFNSKLRSCDIIFPAITSPDHKDIYSKGNYYQIKK